MANDCISRAAAISGIVDLLEMEWGYEGIREDVERIFDELPSVKPTKPKRGRWDWNGKHWECSNCRRDRLHDLVLGLDAAYCPYCGADMRERKGDDERT